VITGTDTLNLRFPGQYLDGETGLHQNWWREYQPSSGRYLQVDPLVDLLHYYRARYRDPNVGRFLSEDRLGGRYLTPLALTLEAEAVARGLASPRSDAVAAARLLDPTYAYAANDPVGHVDPLGQLPRPSAVPSTLRRGARTRDITSRSARPAV
jgi:hypothetical protein